MLEPNTRPLPAPDMQSATKKKDYVCKHTRESQKTNPNVHFAGKLNERSPPVARMARESEEHFVAAETMVATDQPAFSIEWKGLTESFQYLNEIKAGYYPNWLPEDLRYTLWEYTLTRKPYLVKSRGHEVKTRPTINFADPDEQGDYPLYRWGQERRSYALVERIPPPVRAVMNYIETRFGDKTNSATATYYWNGTDQYIPIHCDKKATTRSEGSIETGSRIFNVCLGAVRPFVITSLSSLGKTMREDMDILAEFQMRPGDLYVLQGSINKRFGHGVARDRSVKDLRVSWVFRTVDACFVNPTKQTFREAGGLDRPIGPIDRITAATEKQASAETSGVPQIRRRVQRTRTPTKRSITSSSFQPIEDLERPEAVAVSTDRQVRSIAWSCE